MNPDHRKKKRLLSIAKSIGPEQKMNPNGFVVNRFGGDPLPSGHPVFIILVVEPPPGDKTAGKRRYPLFGLLPADTGRARRVWVEFRRGL